MKAMKAIKQYLFNILIWIDQGANTLLGGSPDHTISGRVGWHALHGNKYAIFWEKVINQLFFDSHHCKNAIEFDIMARKYPYVGNVRKK
jgi:hypothetical protein